MHCTQVEKLIPLHAGNDLPTEQAAIVSAHLAHCASCRALTVEFAASREWLGAFMTLTFDEAAFDELRAAVRQKIAQTEPQPALLTLLTVWWRPRYAVAMAALLLLAGLIFYVHRQQRMPIKENSVALNETNQERSELRPAARSHDTDKTKTVVTAQPPPRRRSLRQQSVAIKPRAVALPAQVIAITTSDTDLILPQAAQQPAVQEMARIEFQTADPNIRIIWLTAPEQATSASQKFQ